MSVFSLFGAPGYSSNKLMDSSITSFMSFLLNFQELMLFQLVHTMNLLVHGWRWFESNLTSQYYCQWITSLHSGPGQDLSSEE